MTRRAKLGMVQDDALRTVHPSPTTLLRVGSAVAAIGLVGIVVLGNLTQDFHDVYWTGFISNVLVVAAIVGAGQVGWARRPASRVGPLLVIAGLLHIAGGLRATDWPIVFTVGFLLGDTFINVLGHALLTFPTGRAASRFERALLRTVYALAVLGWLIPGLFVDSTKLCPGCPRNLALITDAPGFVELLTVVTTFLSVVVAATFVAVLGRKWRRSSTATRRALAPVLAVGALAGAILLVNEAALLWYPDLPESIAWFWVRQVSTFAIPMAFLAGLLRTRMARSAVGELVVELGAGVQSPGGLREALARRLGDPSLQIAYFVPDRGGYVDEQGRPYVLPDEGSGRAVTMLESAGEPIAALVHDEVLRHDPEIVEAVAAAARLAIDNERLQAEVRAQLEEVRASRARIVQAGDAERRRVERNLHDGAQQRLVTLSLAVRLLKERLDHGSDPELGAQVDALSSELREAIADLRELARGIHPAILTEEGLGAAVESLAERSPVPVSLEDDSIGRLPEPVEATAYFVVAESLTNVARYAHASRASVHIERHDGTLRVEVADDGQGGADPAAGSGLRGLQDRVAAQGGKLWVESRAGAGTRVRAEIPCDGR
ncbi:MAG: histidine kinase [Actinobacteria bacterium]|nr:histidine kinase [Actinomycetota bacterium]